MAAYHEAIADLKEVYLEDSYVLGIHETDTALMFDLEVVLTDRHPLYETPPEGMRYCYRKARLSFSGHLSFVWSERNFLSRSVNMDGTIDYGEIDILEVTEDGYHLDGSWGAVKITCDCVQLIFRE